MKGKKGQAGLALLLANPFILLGGAVFIVLILLGVIAFKMFVLGIALVVLGGALLWTQTAKPYISVPILLIGILFVWQPAFLPLSIYDVNQNGGYNIVTDAVDSVIMDGDMFKSRVQVIFSGGSWNRPYVVQQTLVFVDDEYKQNLVFCESRVTGGCNYVTFQQAPVNNGGSNREFLLFDDIVEVDVEGKGEHSFDVVTVYGTPDDTNSRVSLVESCLSGFDKGTESADDLEEHVKTCSEQVRVKRDTQQFFVQGGSIIDVPGNDENVCGVWCRFRLWLSNLI